MSVEIDKSNFASESIREKRNVVLKPYEPTHISTTCSCVKCDSVSCFETRYNKDGVQCTCPQCQFSNNCLFYTFKEVAPTKIKEEHISQKNNDVLKVKNKVLKISKERTDQKFSRIKGSKSDVSKEYRFKYKSFSQTKNKIDSKKNEYYEKDVTRVHSVTVNYSRKDHHNSAAQLSAQVMNVPYQEFKHSVSFNEQRSKSSPISIATQQKRDIFSRIKEIYKACSCKVCECIAGKSLMPRNDTCKCEPCDCTDCLNLSEKFKLVEKDQCDFCCSRNSCHPITRDRKIFQGCDCKPCDCVKCIDESFSKPCDCEPCQCVECEFPITGSMIRRTVVVAPVEGNVQHNVCQCEPCECLNCTHNYGAMTTSLMRETSIGVSTPRNHCNCETCISEACQLSGTICRCENNQRIMRKPMEKDIRDYDIHEALIINKSPFIKSRIQYEKEKQTSVLASPSTNYSATVFNKNQCKCLDCECIICKDKLNKDQGGCKTSHTVKNYKKMQEVNILSSKACKCLPCECQVCMDDKQSEIDVHCSEKSVRNCKCDTCDCIDCYNLSYCLNNNMNQSQAHSKPIKPFSIDREKCFCSPCECTECKTLKTEEKFNYKNSIDILHENLYPLKKGKLLTPSMFEANIIGLSDKNKEDGVRKSEEKVVNKEYSPECLHLPPKQLIFNRNFPCNFSHSALKKSVSFKEKPDSRTNSTNDIETESSPSKGNKVDAYSKNNKNKYNCDVFHAEINIIKSKQSLKTEVHASQTEKKKKHEQSYSQKTKNSSVCQTSKSRNQSIRNSTTRKENIVKKKDSLNIIYDNNLSLDSRSHLKKSSIVLSGTSSNPVKDYNNNSLTTNVNENVRITDTIKRVKKTLENAEEYTKHLMNILENSEKANQEFVSSTQKYINLETSNMKASYNDENKIWEDDLSLPDNNLAAVDTTKSDYLYHIAEKTPSPVNPVKFESCINKDNSIPQEEGLFYENISSGKELTQNNEDIILNCDVESKDSNPRLTQNIQEPEIFKNLNRNGSIISGSNTATKTFGGIYYIDKVVDVPTEQNGSKLLKNITGTEKLNETNTENNSTSMKKNNNITYMDMNNDTKNYIENKCPQIQNNRDTNVGCNIGKKNLYLNTKPIKAKQGVTYHAIENDIKATVQQISNQISSGCEDNGHLANYSEIIVLKKLQKGVSDLLNSYILRSARSANEKSESAQTCQRQAKTKLDLELKYTCNDVASQTFRNKLKVEKEVNCNRVLSMEELYRKMESFLDTTLSRAVYKSEFTSPIQKISDIRQKKPRVDVIKSSCDSLKARFDVVKRVSDHTVLVRWNVPQALKDVEGYEVDGRAVKKIFGPSKCMAVVTCLPHSDRVLLTIRTITSAQLPHGRQPATTIIYRPRNR